MADQQMLDIALEAPPYSITALMWPNQLLALSYTVTSSQRFDPAVAIAPPIRSAVLNIPTFTTAYCQRGNSSPKGVAK